MALALGVEPLIAHLQGKTMADVAAGNIEAPIPEIKPVDGVDSVDLELPGDPPVRVRRYEPATAENEPRPAFVWVHGGAWMFGDLDQPEADAAAQRICAHLDIVVVSVDYRLAPTHTFPAALDDVVAAFDGTIADPGVDEARVAIGGASAGGNLVGGAAQRIRDRGGRQPAANMLVYPATNPAGGPYDAVRPDVCPEVLWFDQPTTSFLFDVYLGSAQERTYAVPADGDLVGLAPTLVTTSSLDGLEDQAVAYVSALRAAGVEVDHHRVDGLLHGYLGMCGQVEAADAALVRHADWLGAQLR